MGGDLRFMMPMYKSALESLLFTRPRMDITCAALLFLLVPSQIPFGFALFPLLAVWPAVWEYQQGSIMTALKRIVVF